MTNPQPPTGSAMIDRATLLRLPRAPRLFLAAGVLAGPKGPLSATGLATTRAEAEARRLSEAAERLASLQSGAGDKATGAGVTWEMAAWSALWEAVERRAVLAWWHGAAPAQVPASALAAAQAAARNWGWPGERLALLEVTQTGHPPTLVALTWAQDGRGVVLGAACRNTPEAAALAALRELCQMEFAAGLVAARESHGRPLSPRESALLDRHRHLEIARFDLAPELSRPPSDWTPSTLGEAEAMLRAAGTPLHLAPLVSPCADRHVALATFEDAKAPSDDLAWPCYV